MLNSIGLIFLVLLIVNFVIDKTLTILNLRHLKQKARFLPAVFQDYIDQETYQRSIAYNSDEQKLGMGESVVSLLLILFLVYGGGFAWIDVMARSVSPQSYYIPALVFGIAIFSFQFLINLPFNLYSTFIIEERYGFNTTSPRLYVSDTIKSLLLSALVGIPLYLGILWFMRAAGSLWWLWCWIFILSVQVVLIIIYPTWIAPLFNTFKPLEEGELKRKTLALARRVSFPVQEILVMDGSKRSRHSNAYFTGIGKKKRIVLFDTLMAHMSIPQVLAVIAHELGHFRLRHIKKMFFLNALLTLVGFYLLSELFRLEMFYDGLGFSQPSNYAALIIFGLCASAVSFVFTPLFSILSRRFEYRADEFAVRHLEQPEGMKEAIALLSKENLSNLHPHPSYSFFHYTHPSPVERMQAIDRAILRKYNEARIGSC